MKAYRVEYLSVAVRRCELMVALYALVGKLNEDFEILKNGAFRVNRNTVKVERITNGGWIPVDVEISEFNI